MREGFAVAWRTWFGLPDGYMVRLRCWVLGHDGYRCEEECCDGRWWCFRCAAPLETGHVRPAWDGGE